MNNLNGSPSPPQPQENYFISNDSSTTISHKRERSLPTSNNYSISNVHPNDDTQIYANLAEIELKKQADFIDRQENPPFPSVNDQPIRTLRNGWKEYKTIGGRYVSLTYLLLQTSTFLAHFSSILIWVCLLNGCLHVLQPEKCPPTLLVKRQI
jgi:hypothetical protein